MGHSSSGASIWCLFFCVIKLEWRALLKLNKDPWPLVHKCSRTHARGTIKALSSEGSWKRIWLEFKTVGNQEKKSNPGSGSSEWWRRRFIGLEGGMGTAAGHKRRDGITFDSLVPAEKTPSGRNKVLHYDWIHVVVTGSRGNQLYVGLVCPAADILWSQRGSSHHIIFF